MFSGNTGIFIMCAFIATFSGLAYLISWLTRDTVNTKLNFLLADRKLPFIKSSVSIAATWVWAPSMFVSCQMAYIYGIQGLFWFLVPNILCLIIFAYFAKLITDKYPEGFTLSSVMLNCYSARVQNVYWVSLLGLAVCAFAVQLLAGGTLISSVLGIPYWISTLLLAFIPLGYSMMFGLRASILTDFIKMIIIGCLGAVLVPMVLINLGGLDNVLNGMWGIKGKYDSIFTADSLTLMLTFGIPTAIGLISGPFGDQSFWQRAFATKTEHIKKSFITGAFIFGIIPLMMGLIGFAASGAGLHIVDVQKVNIETIVASAGLLGIGLFFVIVMSALTSIIDSKMCAVSSIIGHDLSNRYGFSFSVSSKLSMILLACIAILIANIPDLKILYLFLFYGTLRSATFIPTILTLLGKILPESGVFYGIVTAIIVGLPVFAYGNLHKDTIFIVSGSLITLLFPLIIAKAFEKIKGT